MRPMELLSTLVNHRAPSGPGFIQASPSMLEAVQKLKFPAVVIRPMELLPTLVNHRAPSEPVTMFPGSSMLALVQLVTTPEVVIRPMELLSTRAALVSQNRETERAGP